MSRCFLITCAISGFLAVLLGAVGAHALRGQMDEHMVTVWNTASLYHFVHSLAIGLIALLARQNPHCRWLNGSGVAMLAGMLLFSGSLYWRAGGGNPLFAKLAPLGGMALLAGWLLLAVSAVKASGK